MREAKGGQNLQSLKPTVPITPVCNPKEIDAPGKYIFFLATKEGLGPKPELNLDTLWGTREVPLLFQCFSAGALQHLGQDRYLGAELPLVLRFPRLVASQHPAHCEINKMHGGSS